MERLISTSIYSHPLHMNPNTHTRTLSQGGYLVWLYRLLLLLFTVKRFMHVFTLSKCNASAYLFVPSCNPIRRNYVFEEEKNRQREFTYVLADFFSRVSFLSFHLSSRSLTFPNHKSNEWMIHRKLKRSLSWKKRREECVPECFNLPRSERMALCKPLMRVNCLIVSTNNELRQMFMCIA